MTLKIKVIHKYYMKVLEANFFALTVYYICYRLNIVGVNSNISKVDDDDTYQQSHNHVTLTDDLKTQGHTYLFFQHNCLLQLIVAIIPCLAMAVVCML